MDYKHHFIQTIVGHLSDPGTEPNPGMWRWRHGPSLCGAPTSLLLWHEDKWRNGRKEGVISNCSCPNQEASLNTSALFRTECGLRLDFTNNWTSLWSLPTRYWIRNGTGKGGKRKSSYIDILAVVPLLKKKNGSEETGRLCAFANLHFDYLPFWLPLSYRHCWGQCPTIRRAEIHVLRCLNTNHGSATC